MKTIKGPAIFLAQFCGDEKPFNNLKNIASWASSLGYKAVQIPSRSAWCDSKGFFQCQLQHHRGKDRAGVS